MQSVDLARKVRVHSVEMTGRGGGSHVGACLSIADILAVLYTDVLKLNASRPDWPERDRFILSKGHASAAAYAVLAECGFIGREKLLTHYQDGADLCGHVSHKGVAGIELSTGSLGHGLPVGTGMAYVGKQDGKSHRVFVLMSDGECDEGSNWEAILFASHHKLSNLVAIVDYNKIQSLKSVSETLELEPFVDKWKSFGWAVREVDGHDHEAMQKLFESLPFESSRPNCVIAHTTKGKGVSFMEDSVLWHYRSPKGDERAAALAELGVKK